MKKIVYVLIILGILAAMEGISLFVFRSADDPDARIAPVVETRGSFDTSQPVPSQVALSEGVASESFPPPSTEVVNGVTERTVHLGVRQYVWEPATITAKKGELVRLIIHNADVKHGLVVPELGVNQDIPPDGAVVTFTASKQGTFEFFCSVWCGEGHMEMRGKIVIE